MKNKDQIEWLKQIMRELESDAKNGQNVACAVLAVQSRIIALLEAELEDREVA